MNEANEKLLIDIRELSSLTGIAIGTLYHWVSEGRIPYVKLSQRCLRFSLTSIREWLAQLNEPARNEAFGPSRKTVTRESISDSIRTEAVKLRKGRTR